MTHDPLYSLTDYHRDFPTSEPVQPPRVSWLQIVGLAIIVGALVWGLV